MRDIDKTKTQLIGEVADLRQRLSQLSASLEAPTSTTNRPTRHQALLEAIPDLIFVLDRNGVFIDCKAGSEDLLLPPERFLGKTVRQVMPGDLGERIMEAVETALIKGKTATIEYQLTIEDKLRTFESRHTPCNNDEVMVSVREITEFRQTEANLAQALDKTHQYRLLFERTNILPVIAGFDLFFKVINPNWCRTFGYTHAELLSTPYPQFIHPDDRRAARAEALRLAGKKNETVNFECRFRSKDGSYRWLSWNAVVDTAKERFYAVATDITPRKRLERREAAVNCIRRAVSGMRYTDDISTVVEALETTLDKLKLPYHDFGINLVVPGEKKRGFQTLYQNQPRVWTESADRIGYPIVKIWQSGCPSYRRDLQQSDPYGEWDDLLRHFGCPIRAVLDLPFAQGTLAINSQAPNPFDQEEIEILQELAEALAEGFSRLEDFQALEESEQRFRQMADSAPVLIWMSDADDRGTYWNKQWLEFTGRSLPKGLAHPWEIVHKDDVEGARSVYANAYAERLPFVVEYRLRRYDGLYRWLVDRGAPRFTAAGEFLGYIGSCIDITERKMAERELLDSERRYRGVIQDQTELICRFLSNGILTFVNEAFCRYYNKSRGELIGRIFKSAVPPQDAAQTAQLLAELTPQSPVVTHEHRLIDEEGYTCWQQWTHRAFFNSNGSLVEYQGVGRDITESKLAEKRLHQAHTELQQRARELTRSNAELEQFAYVASHDLQEPLRMVASYIQLLERRYGEGLDEKAREFINFAVDGARRMQSLIEDLLTYSRASSDADGHGTTDCNDLMNHLRHTLKFTLADSGASLKVDPLPTVVADSQQLLQVFQNLVSNALKFSRQVPACVHVGYQPLDKQPRFFVRDNGIGIAPDYIQRIFLIFQRLHTRKEYSGTGIGLALCKKIVERHGGQIWVDSTLGKGSTFYFTLGKNSLISTP